MVTVIVTNKNDGIFVSPKIHHYCDNSLSIIVAAPSENPNPIVAANLPLVLSQPRGSCMATEALRSGLMSVAAIHQSYLLARGGATPDGADAMLRIAQHHRMNSKAHLAEACKTMAGTRSDASLAASLAIALTDVSFVVRRTRCENSNHRVLDLSWGSKLVQKHGFSQDISTRSRRPIGPAWY